MDQKMMKIISVILSILLLVSLFLVVNYATNYSSLEERYKKLEDNHRALSLEKDSWAKKVAESKEEISRLKEYQDRYEAVNQELDKANQARDDGQKKIDKLIKENNALLEKLEKILTEKAVSAAGSPAKESPRESVYAPANTDEYWAGILKDKTNLEMESANLKDAVKNAELKAQEYLKDKAAWEIDLQQVTKEKEDLQSSLEYNEKTGDNLSMQLYQEKEDKLRLKKKADILKKENYDLRGRLKEAIGNQVYLEKKLKAVEDKRLELSNRLNQMDEVLQDKLSSLYSAETVLSEIKKSSTSENSSIELSPIVVHSKPAEVKEIPSPEPVSLGKIVNINNENNFVIIDAGESQGIQVGAALRVFREEKQIAVLEVIELRAKSCAADIKEKSVGLEVGDAVRI